MEHLAWKLWQQPETFSFLLLPPSPAALPVHFPGWGKSPFRLEPTGLECGKSKLY